MKKLPAITLNEWQEALDESAARKIQSVPPGWITILQFGEMINRGPGQARRDMLLMMESGRAESKKFSIQSGFRIYPIRHYRLIKKK